MRPEMHPAHLDTLDVSLPARVGELATVSETVASWFHQAKKPDASAPSKPLLTFEGVSFGYTKDKEVLKDVSFTIHKGEMISLVGQNGAGKSTISKLICGFYKPTSGRILLEGRDLIEDTIKERAMKIGMVMQNPNQMISHNMIYDEVAFGLRIRGIAEEEVEKRVEATLEICGLNAYRKWPINALSYGQKKRVTIAAILVLEPELIILDEPTAGQDFKHYTEIMNFLETVNKRGITILMITHDMNLMLEYTKRALVLAGGRLLADTTSTEVLTDQEIIKASYLKAGE